MQVTPESTQGAPSWLLQLPASVLPLVLQQLDQRSLASTAATCNALRPAFPAHLSQLDVCFKSSWQYTHFVDWLEENCTSLQNLEQWSLHHESNMTRDILGLRPEGPSLNLLSRLPQLRQLQLKGVMVQLGHSHRTPGVLRQCTCLTALDLNCCDLRPPSTAYKAFAALQNLQSLRLAATGSWEQRHVFFLPVGELLTALHHASQLTQLIMDLRGYDVPQNEVEELSQLSKLTSLKHLDLGYVPSMGLTGGFPSQLVGLTTLRVSYVFKYTVINNVTTAEQFQHLSALTALQELSVISTDVLRPHSQPPDFHQGQPSSMPGIGCLSQLTSLELELCALGLQFGTFRGESWTRLTALQHLTLHEGLVQLDPLATFTQLRGLRLDGFHTNPGHLGRIFGAVGQLSLLTDLLLSAARVVDPPPEAAFTALTASTNLCSLQVGNVGMDGRRCILFRPGLAYPILRLINLRYADDVPLSLSEQQLQRLCSCCPAVESLVFTPCKQAPPTALQPLLQLSALTRLEVYSTYTLAINAGDFERQLTLQQDAQATAAAAAAAAAATAGVGAGVVGVVAQLTGLKHLVLEFKETPRLTDPVLLQLTALTALEHLRMRCYREFDSEDYRARLLMAHQARCGHPPSVWAQLLCHLERSSPPGAAAAAAAAGTGGSAGRDMSSGNSSRGPEAYVDTEDGMEGIV